MLSFANSHPEKLDLPNYQSTDVGKGNELMKGKSVSQPGLIKLPTRARMLEKSLAIQTSLSDCYSLSPLNRRVQSYGFHISAT